MIPMKIQRGVKNIPELNKLVITILEIPIRISACFEKTLRPLKYFLGLK
jgi:hypothetical protein